MSLLESLILLLGDEGRVLSSSAEAELITGLLSMLTQPLDGIPDNPIDTDPGSQQVKGDTLTDDPEKSSTPAQVKPTLKGTIA
jgi:hypothetical protein